MPDLHITLSDDSQAFVTEQIARGSFASPSAFFENLVEVARLHAERQRIDSLLLEGLDSGPGSDATPDYWQRTKSALSRKYDQADRP